SASTLGLPSAQSARRGARSQNDEAGRLLMQATGFARDPGGDQRSAVGGCSANQFMLTSFGRPRRAVQCRVFSTGFGAGRTSAPVEADVFSLSLFMTLLLVSFRFVDRPATNRTAPPRVRFQSEAAIASKGAVIRCKAVEEVWRSRVIPPRSRVIPATAG